MIAKVIPRVCGAILAAALLLAAAAPLEAAPKIDAPADARPGDPVPVWTSNMGELVSVEIITANGTVLSRASGFAIGSLHGAVPGIPSTAKEGEGRLVMKLRAADGSIGIAERPIRITGRAFATEVIPLGRENSALRTEPDPRRTAETLEFAAIFRRADPGAVHLRATMNRPLGTWRVTAGFGDRRRYRYEGGGSDTSIHGGLDLAAPAGTPVIACAPGHVVFARPRILTGNTVVLEHLPGLFSIYMHLDSIAAKEGTVVAAAEPIGAAGSTGLSTGPHLHWEIRAGEIPVDPEYFLERDLVP